MASSPETRSISGSRWEPFAHKLLVVAFALMVLVPSSQAVLVDDEHATVQIPVTEPALSDPPTALTLVAGHTVYPFGTPGSGALQQGPLGPPDDREHPTHATLGQEADHEPTEQSDADVNSRVIQRECVVWSNGWNIDQRIDGAQRSFPGDDWNTRPGWAGQDYSFARDVPDCGPFIQVIDPDAMGVTSLGLVTDFAVVTGSANKGTFAVAVERGDCDPLSEGENFRYRGQLDFVDPNGIYHEVQEYDYTCPDSYIPGRSLQPPLVPLDPLGLGGPGVGPLGHTLGPSVQQLHPWTGQDPHNELGCDPRASDAPLEGQKCRGSLQDLFTERLWITPIHAPVYDPMIDRSYDHALQVDTCAGLNLYEADGKKALGGQNDYLDAHRLPEGDATTLMRLYHEATYHAYAGIGLDAVIGEWLLQDVCTDGSSFSLNDTPRGRLVHSGPPQGQGDLELMNGNSYDFDWGSDTFEKHRTNCRTSHMDWPLNTYPPGPPNQDASCYIEDHKTAQLDIHVYDTDPTGLWNQHKNDLTGPATWTPSGAPTP